MTTDTSGHELALAQAEAMIERQAAELKRLRERCNPSTLVMIGDTGHYVSDAVAAEIGRLQRHVAKDADAYWDARESLMARIEALRDENESLASNLRGKHATTGATYAHLIAERDRLRDENAKLRADAERYAFLRDSTCCSLILSRNEDHACNYVAAKQWIEEFGAANDWSDVPPDELQRMKDTNTIWALQIYPNTPVGFNRWSRSTLDAAIDAAMQKGE